MPLNAANKEVFVLAASRTNKYWIGSSDVARKVPATCEFFNESFDDDLVLQFQNSDDGTTYADVDPDGYTASGGITVKPRGILTVSFGVKDDGAGARLNLLGPYVQIDVTSGIGQVSVTLADETAYIQVI